METDEPPLVNGTVLRAYVEHVRSLGLEAAVRARLSPAALQKVDKPPLPLSWFDSRLSNEISVALVALRDRDTVRAMGRAITADSLVRLLRPLLATSMALFGSTPATVFSRLETFSSLLVRNAEFNWQPSGERSGTMRLQHKVEIPDAAYALWEGVFSYVFELTSTKSGVVGRARLLDNGRAAVIDLSW